MLDVSGGEKVESLTSSLLYQRICMEMKLTPI